MVRVPDHYQRELLIGNDNRMNGRLNSAAPRRKNIALCEFPGRIAAPHTRTAEFESTSCSIAG